MRSSNLSLKQVYDRSCVREKDETRKTGTSIKPSMLGSPCIRKIYYSYNKTPEDNPFPLSNSRVANLGTAIGKMLFEAYDREGIAVRYRKLDGTYEVDRDGTPDYEFRLTSEELGVKLGKIDLVCRLDDGLWLAEFKSINARGFGELSGPKPDHLVQGVLYLYLFNQHLKDGKFSHIPELAGYQQANGMRFVYYGKDRSELKEFVVTKADQVFVDIVNKIQTVKSYSENDELPPPTPDWCNSCAWRGRCQKNQKAHEN